MTVSQWALCRARPGRVVYFGTVGTSLAPGLRLAWMVLSVELVLSEGLAPITPVDLRTGARGHLETAVH